MEDHTDLLESLIEKATDYCKTSYNLAKLSTIDKTSGLLSSLLSNAVFLIVFLLFVLFLNFGLAIWIGKILEEISIKHLSMWQTSFVRVILARTRLQYLFTSISENRFEEANNISN